MLHAEAVFAPEVGSARLARTFVRTALEAHALPADLAVLLVSELATNAVLHARTDYVVRLTSNDGRVRVEVQDANERSPSIAHAPPEATSGRGLQLVQTLSAGWGVEGRPDGKVVWFEVDACDNDREAAFA
ncbi:MAG TPA: ATP-binding protein [Acidimicrobiales bacterium]